MDVFNRAMTRLFDLVFLPFRGLEPAWGVSILAGVLGVILVWAFGRLSNQGRLREMKQKIKGHMLEVWLFRHSSRAMFRAQYRTLSTTLRYTLLCLKSFVILMVPVVLIMIQVQARYGYAPLQPGDSALVRIVYREPTPLDSMTVSLETDRGLLVDTPALRIPDDREVNFRIRARQEGVHELVVRASQDRVTKSVCVGRDGVALAPLRTRNAFHQLLYPTESALPSGALASIEVAYPGRAISFLGWEMHWIWPFFLVSILAGIVAKSIMRVEL